MTNEELDAIEQIYMSFGDNETVEAIEILNKYAESYHAKKCAECLGKLPVFLHREKSEYREMREITDFSNMQSE